MIRKTFVLLSALLMSTTLSLVHASSVQVTVTNHQSQGGFYFTPVWVGFHDGGFDTFNGGEAASSQLEALAEDGNVAPLRGVFGGNADGTARVDSVVFGADGFPGAPVFDPGESASELVDVTNAGSNRYLSFGSMIIPSNDAFFANGNPFAYEIFNSDGDFNGPITISIYGQDIYDSGTEVNDGLGAAFSATGGTDSVEGGVVGFSPGLDIFIGTDTAAGTTIGSAIGRNELVATIQINDANAVPEPSAVAIWAVFGIIGGFVAYRKQRR